MSKETAPNCCKTRPAKYFIVYSCGANPDEEIILCNYHYDLDPVFKEHIKKIEDVKEC